MHLNSYMNLQTTYSNLGCRLSLTVAMELNAINILRKRFAVILILNRTPQIRFKIKRKKEKLKLNLRRLKHPLLQLHSSLHSERNKMKRKYLRLYHYVHVELRNNN